MGGPRAFTIKLQTPGEIWTGDHRGKSKVLRETGLIGSIRWWYEALIRALGGTACDPADDSGCGGGDHCDACELFGCTGWSRKFILRCSIDGAIRIRITELRKMDDMELSLLNTTFRIIEKYGAIGGKLAEKDYGIIHIERNDLNFKPQISDVQSYLRRRGESVDNPNLRRFIFMNNPSSDFVKELRNNCSFLKGTNKSGKRYFHKSSDRFFAYALNDREYEELRGCAGGNVTSWDHIQGEFFEV